MSQIALAAVFAVFIWWFSTGVVLLLNRLSRGPRVLALGLSSLLACAALLALAHTAEQTSVAGAYCAFTSALLVWGWNELSFLTGWITGPRKTALAEGTSEAERLWQALRVVLWHEIGIVAVGLAIGVLTWNAPNSVGRDTYAVLWVMRSSAKLNLYFGVRNLSEQFLPPQLAYLASCFRRRAMNLLFPVSVVAATAVLLLLAAQAVDVHTTPAQAVGLSLVATLLALAVVEHLMLVLPLDTAALWRWALRRSPPAADQPATATASPTPFEAAPSAAIHAL